MVFFGNGAKLALVEKALGTRLTPPLNMLLAQEKATKGVTKTKTLQLLANPAMAPLQTLLLKKKTKMPPLLAFFLFKAEAPSYASSQPKTSSTSHNILFIVKSLLFLFSCHAPLQNSTAHLRLYKSVT